MHFTVVIEKAGSNYSAYVPDLPDCVATGATVQETESEIRNAIRFHLDEMKKDATNAPPVATGRP